MQICWFMLQMRSDYTSSKTVCSMCWQGCRNVQDWGGQVLGAVGFFPLQLKAFVSSRNAPFPLSYCFALFCECFGRQQDCRALSYNLSHHERKWKVWGHLVGTWIADFQLDQTHAADAEVRGTSTVIKSGGRRSLQPCKRSASVGILLPLTPARRSTSAKPVPSFFYLCLHLICWTAKQITESWL